MGIAAGNDDLGCDESWLRSMKNVQDPVPESTNVRELSKNLLNCNLTPLDERSCFGQDKVH